MTKEELLKLSVEELAEQLIEIKSKNDFWYEQYQKLKLKLSAFQSVIKSMSLLIEN